MDTVGNFICFQCIMSAPIIIHAIHHTLISMFQWCILCTCVLCFHSSVYMAEVFQQLPHQTDFDFHLVNFVIDSKLLVTTSTQSPSVNFDCRKTDLCINLFLNYILFMSWQTFQLEQGKLHMISSWWFHPPYPFECMHSATDNQITFHTEHSVYRINIYFCVSLCESLNLPSCIN